MPRIRDQRPYNVAYYARNRETEIARVKRRQNERIELLRDVRRVPCEDCRGQFEPWQMDFDHRNPEAKSFEIGRRGPYVSRKRLLLEIRKCAIVCANCHRVRTLVQHRARLAGRELVGSSRGIERRREHWRANAALLDQLRDVPCFDCGGTFPPCAMEFDHRDPNTKVEDVTRLISKGRRRMLEEAAKCDIVCTNCHRNRTYVRRRGGVTGRE